MRHWPRSLKIARVKYVPYQISKLTYFLFSIDTNFARQQKENGSSLKLSIVGTKLYTAIKVYPLKKSIT
jgi:ABC-type transporter Mla MlaB component